MGRLEILSWKMVEMELRFLYSANFMKNERGNNNTFFINIFLKLELKILWRIQKPNGVACRLLVVIGESGHVSFFSP